MVYKKYIKRGGKIYGPYKYHSRKVNGKVITDYLGKDEVKNKKNKTLIFLIIGFLLLFSLVFVLNYKSMTGFAIFGSENENLAFIRFAIEIIKAEHLDENRQFISDIYEQVKALDDIWSETISDGDYVRVTFEKNLTNENDIIIYPRVVNRTPKIEVYEIDGTELIAEFTNINSNQYNKVLLINLQGTQNIFDLLILDDSIEIEHIVDPKDNGGKFE